MTRNRRLFQLIGLMRIVIFSCVLVLAVLCMPVALFFDYFPQFKPTTGFWGEFYANPTFLWQVAVMIVSAICFYLINGFIYLFFGWKMMHPLKNKTVDITERRKMIVDKGLEIKQQIMDQILKKDEDKKSH